MKQRMNALFSVVLLICSALSMADAHRGPQLQPAGLLIPDSAIPLSQANFTDGPYRITQPGYYYFTENVSFDPYPAGSNGIDGGRTNDRPQTGAWFTALSVECDNVIIDLNTKTFDCSESFVNNHEFKVFSMIELNNSPFQHLIFAYGGETELIAAHNVTIKNGTLGRNAHHGIHGNLNSNVQIYDLVIKDWEVAGISLNGLKSGEIRNITITGVEHEVKFTGLLAEIDSANGMLEVLRDGGDTYAQAYIDDLQAFKAQVLYDGHPSGTHDGNCYGLFINRTVDVGPVPTQHCTDGTANCVLIDNVTVCNVKASIIETVGIADLSNERLKGAPFGVLRWYDAYAGPGNTFAPNALLKAQVYVVHNTTPENYPAGFAANILADSPNEATFLSQVKPIFEGDFAGHTNKGVFGIRVDCGHDVSINNCRVAALENVGDTGKSLDDIPAGSNYDFTINRYHGNDVHGISLAACRNCSVTNCKVFECSSVNGYVHGVSVVNESEGNTVVNCLSVDHYAQRADVGSTINPPSEVVGFFIDNNVKNNIFRNCQASSLSCPRNVCGFQVSYASDTVLDTCTASSNTATDSANLSTAKYAVGFRSRSSNCTVMSNCTAACMACEGEASAVSASLSETYGFVLESDGSTDDTYGVIEKSDSRCHNAGSGRAAGIQLTTGVEQATIVDNEMAGVHTATSYGLGYGLHDMAGNLNSMILRNIGHGNKTRNFFTSYAEGQLPLTTALYTDIGNCHFANTWNNICLEKAPGSEFTGSNTNNTVMIRQIIRN